MKKRVFFFALSCLTAREEERIRVVELQSGGWICWARAHPGGLSRELPCQVHNMHTAVLDLLFLLLLGNISSSYSPFSTAFICLSPYRDIMTRTRHFSNISAILCTYVCTHVFKIFLFNRENIFFVVKQTAIFLKMCHDFCLLVSQEGSLQYC